MWDEPQSAREQALSLKLVKTQQSLHRARAELLHRSNGERERKALEKLKDKDWTLALRFRLTAELRAELDSMSEAWESDRSAAKAKQADLEQQLEKLKRDKDLMTSRLMQEVIELQRLYARTGAEREMMVEVLRPEVRNAELDHQRHQDALELEVARLESLRISEAQKQKAEIGRLNAALTGVCEDLHEERQRKKALQASTGMEIDRLRSEMERLTSELAQSQMLHAKDVAELRAERNNLSMELQETTEALTRRVSEVTAAKEKQGKELSDALMYLKAKKDQGEARLVNDLKGAEERRRAETSALNAKVKQLRGLQQQALDTVLKGGKARQAAFIESLKTPGKKDSPYWRGDPLLAPASAAALANDDAAILATPTPPIADVNLIPPTASVRAQTEARLLTQEHIPPYTHISSDVYQG
jgi:hypothetical protein